MNRNQVIEGKQGSRFFRKKTVREVTLVKMRNADTVIKKYAVILDVFVDLGFIDKKDKPR